MVRPCEKVPVAKSTFILRGTPIYFDIRSDQTLVLRRSPSEQRFAGRGGTVSSPTLIKTLDVDIKPALRNTQGYGYGYINAGGVGYEAPHRKVSYRV